MKFTKIYVEADEKIINQILEIARNGLGYNVNAINLHPELVEESNEEDESSDDVCKCGHERAWRHNTTILNPESVNSKNHIKFQQCEFCGRDIDGHDITEAGIYCKGHYPNQEFIPSTKNEVYNTIDKQELKVDNIKDTHKELIDKDYAKDKSSEQGAKQ